MKIDIDELFKKLYGDKVRTKFIDGDVYVRRGEVAMIVDEIVAEQEGQSPEDKAKDCKQQSPCDICKFNELNGDDNHVFCKAYTNMYDEYGEWMPKCSPHVTCKKYLPEIKIDKKEN